ncbi:hypothetical protein GCM10007977_110490 [Dactylosporangium sucinum]|uniref:Uncharacterized protein n=1 Tax=Dactylosporangium sucinum TaxID=1424081 RepID=A0A917UIR4_9ACTN|nr:hypothetical protein GCM10007977_110490 [Dactylosporangium sucinum]
MPGISGINTTAGPKPAVYTVFTIPSTFTSRREKSVIASSRRPLAAFMATAWTAVPAQATGPIAMYGGNLARGWR